MADWVRELPIHIEALKGEFMKTRSYVLLFVLLGVTLSVLWMGQAASADKVIVARAADVDGASVHYLMAGRGAPVILLHGYTQTSRMWRPIIPILAEKFRVIAPDLPGIGDSDIPRGDVDMTTAATRIRALAKLLGADKASVVGHDIGLMVAYAYAAQFPADVEKLVVMDAFLPGVGGWESVYNNPGTAKDFAQLSERKLPMPVLAIGGAKANGELLAQQMKLVASDVTVVVLSDTGHWVLEERPKETTEALMKFL